MVYVTLYAPAMLLLTAVAATLVAEVRANEIAPPVATAVTVMVDPDASPPRSMFLSSQESFALTDVYGEVSVNVAVPPAVIVPVVVGVVAVPARRVPKVIDIVCWKVLILPVPPVMDIVKVTTPPLAAVASEEVNAANLTYARPTAEVKSADVGDVRIVAAVGVDTVALLRAFKPVVAKLKSFAALAVAAGVKGVTADD
jgi:hypothetical protein